MASKHRSPSPAGEGGGWSDVTADRTLDPVRVGLKEGARVLASLDLRRGLSEGGGVLPDSLVLTDSQLAHVDRTGRRMTSSVVPVRDVSAARVESDRRGPGEYAWGALAILLGLLLWRVVEHPAAGIAAGAVVAAMGVYLIAEKLLRPITSVVLVLSDDGLRLRCPLRGGEARTDAYEFISRIYARKAELERIDRAEAAPGPRGPSRARYSNRVFRRG